MQNLPMTWRRELCRRCCKEEPEKPSTTESQVGILGGALMEALSRNPIFASEYTAIVDEFFALPLVGCAQTAVALAAAGYLESFAISPSNVSMYRAIYNNIVCIVLMVQQSCPNCTQLGTLGRTILGYMIAVARNPTLTQIFTQELNNFFTNSQTLIALNLPPFHGPPLSEFTNPSQILLRSGLNTGGMTVFVDGVETSYLPNVPYTTGNTYYILDACLVDADVTIVFGEDPCPLTLEMAVATWADMSPNFSNTTNLGFTIGGSPWGDGGVITNITVTSNALPIVVAPTVYDGSNTAYTYGAALNPGDQVVITLETCSPLSTFSYTVV